MADPVRIVPAEPVRIVRRTTPIARVVSQVGPQGPAGPPGVGAGYLHEQATPAATWTIPTPAEFTRPPAVTVLDDAGRIVLADVESSLLHVVIVFAQPVSGKAILT